MAAASATSFHSYPFVIETSAVIRAKLLVFGKDFETAHEIAHERFDEMMTAIDARYPGMKTDDVTGFQLTARAAYGYEVAGSDAIAPGMVTLVTTDTHADCDDDDMEDNL